MRLARAERVGPITYRRLMRRYGSAAAAIAALPGLARAGGGAAPRLIGRERAAREFELADRLGARLLLVDQPGYPPLLGLLEDAPPMIAVLGDPARLSLGAVAVVGSRNASAAGRNIAQALAEALAGQGIAVVSGLARGVDAAAHEGALRARDGAGVTLAAVAGGLDVPYPPEHAGLQARIAATGAVISEAPFGTNPQARHFPQRNRLIAGLALGVVVIEAAPRSGSLITARLALESGRELFAVPGSPLDPRCRGSNDLIRQGAHLTETIDDILANLPVHPDRIGVQRLPLFAQPEAPLPDTPLPDHDAATHMAEPATGWHPGRETAAEALRGLLVGLLGPTPTGVDDLVAHSRAEPQAVAAALLELELAGRVAFLPGQRVIRADAPTTD